MTFFDQSIYIAGAAQTKSYVGEKASQKDGRHFIDLP